MIDTINAPWLLVLIAVFGLASLAFFFLRTKKDAELSKLTIRAVGIVLVIVTAALLAVAYESAVVAAVGLLGAVAGYLFGSSSSTGGNESQATVRDITGDDNRVAGRDIVERLDSALTKLESLESLNANIEKFESTMVASDSPAHGYHVHEERIPAFGRWAANPAPVSDIARASERALTKFAPPYFRLVATSTIGVSDFIHVLFVFAAESYAAGEVQISLECTPNSDND
ncbi:MAG: hypothetical protein P0Y48_07485 [Candidatus Microbacterium phytovorans]|uniref:Uncharacterized protein n=1 Tax=Candidatus Microbacterium phytovorans TaxID=3121374 RepID=A0AAJ5VY64_9MICO|nr:hypothetical protein [Microbacterium sp.]WEK12327.1 MAG: hypothetical protein P0Y48_07485 [Microbacterium sp.]